MTDYDHWLLSRGCVRKRRFDTRADARTAARISRRLSGHGTIKAYYCEWCDGWHIGHNTWKRRHKHADQAGE